MSARLECNGDIWRRIGSSLPAAVGVYRTSNTLDATGFEDDYNFDNRHVSPWVGVYRPTDEGVGFHYGSLWIIRNPMKPLPDETFASSNGKYMTQEQGSEPYESLYTGADTFNNCVYNINYFTPLEKVEIIDAMEPNMLQLIGKSVIINNVPIFKSESGTTDIDFNDDSLYMGCAYKNGRFYQEPLNLDDPYIEDPAEDTSDNQGTNDWTPDNITMRNLPPDFFGDSGLLKIYTPTKDELNAFSAYLWNDDFNIDQFKKIVNNPFDLILGFQWLPFKVTIAGQSGVNVGNILSVDTHLSMSYPTQENYQHSFGSLNISGQEHKFLDYAPYSKSFIHLPYIGTQTIDTDLIRACSPVELIYKYNIVTGTICAILRGSINGQNGVLYEWVGNVNNTIPVASNDYSNTISGMFGMITNAVSGAVVGGAVGGGIGAAAGALSGSVSGLNQADLKPTITTQGSIGGAGGCLNASCDAFIVTEQQRLSVAGQHSHYLGYPRNVSGKISNNGGYNNIKACRMSCRYAYQEELQEIEQILINGYIYGTLIRNSEGEIIRTDVISKPSTPSGDNVVFALYQNKSSNARIDKELDHLHTYDCILKDTTSIVNPTIRIKATDVNVTKGNYGYIPKFKRFYYINNVRTINADIWEIDLHCDVLMSFRDDIIDHTVIFNHSEKAFNMYLNDGSLQMDSRPKITWDKFPNSLTEEGTYVLILAGSQSNE